MANARWTETPNGISNAVLRKLRTLHCAATRVSSAASSTTAKLALGGEKHADVDPAVRDTGAPLFKTLDKLWDQPQTRAEFVLSWNAAVNGIMEAGGKWNNIRGPVGAAVLTVLRANGQWPNPFQIELMGHTIPLLDTPPRQIQAIYYAQARRALDNELVKRTVQEYEEEERNAIQHTYRYGIDWESIRGVLNENGTEGWAGDKAARAALHTVVSGGFWPEVRRWHAGRTGTSSCEACFQGCGNQHHKFWPCEALAIHLFWKKLEGSYSPVKQDFKNKAPRLLTEFGWPPIVKPWQPTKEEINEGSMLEVWDGDSFGDGSGAHQQNKEDRIATWAVVRQNEHGKILSCIRGNVTGWFPTVLRSELIALIMHLKTSVIPARYIGDCLTVINGAKGGVNDRLCSSKSLHADLWRQIRNLMNDHGEGQTIQKTKAHRSRVQAENSTDDPVSWWMGNRNADMQAKALSAQIAKKSYEVEAEEQERRGQAVRTCLRHIGVAAQWHFSFWPEARKRLRCKPEVVKTEDGTGSGQHRLAILRNRGWQCTFCFRQAWTNKGRRRLKQIPCVGNPTSAIHQSHVLHSTRGVVWCIKCGAHTKRMPVTLAKECVAAPRSGAYRNVIRRLNEGRMPTEGQDREGDAVETQIPCIWEGTSYNANTRIRKRTNSMRDAEREAMADRMAMKRRRLTKGQQQQGTSGYLKRLREQVSERLVSKRRRIHGKEAVQNEMCAALAAEKWVHRVRNCLHNCADACMVCGSATLTRCRSCARPICIGCAKEKAQCIRN